MFWFCMLSRVVFLLSFFLSALFSETIQEITIPPKEEDNFIHASFRMWIPDGVEKPEAILVLLPGFNGNGLDWIEKKI